MYHIQAPVHQNILGFLDTRNSLIYKQANFISVRYEVCPKSSWTSLSKVLDKHIGLKAYAFHKVQHQLNNCSKFHENSYSCFGVTLS